MLGCHESLEKHTVTAMKMTSGGDDDDEDEKDDHDSDDAADPRDMIAWLVSCFQTYEKVSCHHEHL